MVWRPTGPERADGAGSLHSIYPYEFLIKTLSRPGIPKGYAAGEDNSAKKVSTLFPETIREMRCRAM